MCSLTEPLRNKDVTSIAAVLYPIHVVKYSILSSTLLLLLLNSLKILKQQENSLETSGTCQLKVFVLRTAKFSD